MILHRRVMTFPGLGDCQEAYSPYPNALLSLRFIISVGKIIMADSQVEPGEVKEGDNMTMSKPRTPLSRPSAVSICMKQLHLRFNIFVYCYFEDLS